MWTVFSFIYIKYQWPLIWSHHITKYLYPMFIYWKSFLTPKIYFSLPCTADFHASPNNCLCQTFVGTHHWNHGWSSRAYGRGFSRGPELFDGTVLVASPILEGPRGWEFGTLYVEDTVKLLITLWRVNPKYRFLHKPSFPTRVHPSLYKYVG